MNAEFRRAEGPAILTADAIAVGRQLSLVFLRRAADCKSAIVGSTPTGASRKDLGFLKKTEVFFRLGQQLQQNR